MPVNVLLYGVALRDAIARGSTEEMIAFANVSQALLDSAQASDLEDDTISEWKAAHEELLVAVAESSGIEVDSEDIIAIRDGIIVIDNIELARALKPIVSSDLEPRLTITISW